MLLIWRTYFSRMQKPENCYRQRLLLQRAAFAIKHEQPIPGRAESSRNPGPERSRAYAGPPRLPAKWTLPAPLPPEGVRDSHRSRRFLGSRIRDVIP